MTKPNHVRGILNTTGNSVAGIVDQHVDLAVPGDGGADLVLDVAGDKIELQPVPAQLLDLGGDGGVLGGVAAACDDLVAGSQGSFGGLKSEAAGCSGYKPSL